MFENVTPRATAGADVLVKDFDGNVVTVITSSGDVGLAGAVYEGQGTLSPSGGSLLFKNGTGEVVAYVSATGDLYLRGTVTSGP